MANPKSKKRKKTVIVFLLLLVVAALGTVAFFKKKEAVITVQEEKVVRRNLTELVVANGKIQPVIQVKLSPEVSGEIIALPVKEGQDVKKGDLLVKIKPDPYVASKNSAEANYKYALASKDTSAATLEKARLEYQRNEQLHKNNLISDSDYLTAKTDYDVAKANLVGAEEQAEMAQANLAHALDDLSKTTIYSPITGTVTKLYSQVGERVVGTATMAGTDIMIVSDLNEMEARVDIGEIDVVLIQVGQKARLEVDSYKDRKFPGVVTDIADSAKNSDSTTAASSSSSQEATKFQVKIRVTEKESFRPGMSVTAEIETRSRTNSVTVPIQSVTTRLPKEPASKGKTTGSTALAADPPPAGQSAPGDKKKAGERVKPIEVVFVANGDRVKMVPVKRGIADDNYVEILEGLKEGDTVISGGSKAINRELEDDKRIMVGTAKSDLAAESPN